MSVSNNEEENMPQKHRFEMLTLTKSTKYAYRNRHVCIASEGGEKHP